MSGTVIYCRYSPRPHESESIQAQAEDLQAWCANTGLDVALICFDPDVSGTVPFHRRPGLATALSWCKKGDVFVVRNLNRAARSIGIGLAIEEELDRIGATLAVPENGGIQRSKREDRNAWCMRVIMYLMSDMQRMEINERTSRRMHQHQANGRAMGGSAPDGWRKDGKTLVKHPEEQVIVNQIAVLAQNLHTPSEIAARLRRDDVPCRGSRWHSNTVRRVLKRLEG